MGDKYSENHYLFDVIQTYSFGHLWMYITKFYFLPAPFVWRTTYDIDCNLPQGTVVQDLISNKSSKPMR